MCLRRRVAFPAFLAVAPTGATRSHPQQQQQQHIIAASAVAVAAMRGCPTMTEPPPMAAEDGGIEADIAAVNASSSDQTSDEFERLRKSIHAGSGSASVYSRPSGQGAGFEDPALAELRSTRLFVESVVDTDPLGGMHRPDYYRDPARGYAPQHAPRNFAVGGSVDAYHPMSPLHYGMSVQGRIDGDHDQQKVSEAAARMRTALLRSESGLQFHQQQQFRSGGEAQQDGDTAAAASAARQSGTSILQRGDALFSAAHRSSSDVTVQSFFDGSAVARTAKNVVGSRNSTAASSSGSEHLSWLDASSLEDQTRTALLDAQREQELEQFRRVHGERDRERFEENRAELYGQRNPGYDVDRMAAKAAGMSNFRGLESLIPPGSAAEAQRELRRNNVSAEHSTWHELSTANSTAAAPLMGEALTDQLVSTSSARKNTAYREMVDEWQTATGRGRHGALVQDQGPDQRTQKLGKNDERLLHASLFEQNVYKQSDAAVRARSPYAMRKTDSGVGHLLRTQFDRQRREDKLANGEQDPIERSTIHLGTPVRERVDDKVRNRVNMRVHRPIEYFLPSPREHDMLMMEGRADVEGFPLFSGKLFSTKLAPFEWDLFVRYRGHVAQRQALALEHGLEPRPNEGVEERAARRLVLDELCERTPFDAARFMVLDHGMSMVPVGELRQWFGAYWVPSPSLCAVILGKSLDTGVHLVEELRGGTGDDIAMLDDREHVLSARYISKLLTLDDFNARLQRSSIKDQYFGRAPEPELKHKVPESVLRHFSPEQRAAYDEYVKVETDRHAERWESVLRGTRILPPEYNSAPARLMKSYSNEVVTLVNTANGQKILSSSSLVQQQIANSANNNNNNNNSGNTKSITIVDAAMLNAGGATVVLDGGVRFEVEAGSLRREMFVSVKTDAGAVIEMLQRDWNSIPETHSPTGGSCRASSNTAVQLDPNTHITVSTTLPQPFPYNRLNYVETQDTLWEGRVAQGQEGWTTAVHPDNLQRGMPIRARRVFHDERTGQMRYGDYARAVVDNYFPQPFYNPEQAREVSVRFAVGSGDQPVVVPLASTLIWQAAWGASGRTERLTTRRLNLGIRRFVNMKDPHNESQQDGAKQHFLDRYLTSRQRQQAAARWRTTKSIGDIDSFTKADINRPHNHRLISGTGVRHYVRSGFLHRYTPWEFILAAEAEAPIIAEQIRPADREGTSHYFAPNRFWRYKRRPYGYIQNHRDEVRDLFQYIDGLTPWEAAKQVRTHWETREHHPMPAYFRPHNLHRNTAGLLPTHLWESDKKTGKVKVLKDSLKDYKPLRVHPAWVNM